MRGGARRSHAKCTCSWGSAGAISGPPQMNDRRPDEIAPDEAWQARAAHSRRWAFFSSLLADLTGLAGHQELGDVPRALVRDGSLFLFDQDLVVRGHTRAGGEHPERAGVVGGLEMSEHEGGPLVGLVVDPERTLGNVLD